MDNPRYRSLPAGLPDLDRCAVMGVVNVTPDSFSDGGLWHDPARAIAHGLALRARGADLIDVGGESTRPGARRVTEKEELERVLPVVRELAEAGVVVSIDTMRASVAEQAVAAGARLVNDVSGGLADPAMAEVVAATGAPFVVMHWRGQSADMESLAVYGDVVTDVVAELTRRMEALLAAGVQERQLILDPGLGFAKTTEHNWALLGRLDALTALGRPVLVAASRKRFLGTLLANPETGELRPARERDDATAAVSVLSAGAGAWAVRVHDVAGTADAVRVVAAWQRAARQG
ncbi:dihydropteroate synthase [Kitasatospora herbaricolor]|uniref:dihydropteroate synthase n=1 Tax=Kitasatospora herbaricolor TaxID=68217 RepID=UPI001749E10B|nr:dihydropteroate synthase [Kitasatospora herbaricolor]MDQ0310029.1 dihydropteroate synthase [Kitasatospora herbaricolor]GGV17480.1 dihydropteroate synthase [Kitasatospora herbaricolor]